MLYKRNIITIVLLLCTVFSFSQSARKRYNWKHLGPFTTPASNMDSLQWTSTGLGWVEDILILEDRWLAGSITGGVYCSKNEGKSWKKLDKDTPVQLGTLCLVNSRNTIFRGTGLTHYDEDFGYGLFKSTNKGKSWQPTGLQFKANEKSPLWAVDVSSFDSSIVACTHKTVYTSKDFGENWKATYTAQSANFRTVLFSKHLANTVFTSGARLLKSEDNGVNWEDRTNQLSLYNTKVATKVSPTLGRIALCEDPNKAGRMLAFYSFDRQTYIDESTDFGDSWHNMYSSYAISRIDIHHAEIAIAPNNSNCIVIGGVRSYLSTNNGREFSQVTFPFYKDVRFAHDDIRGMKLVSANEFFLATDGGVFRTTDTGRTWKNVSGNGLAIMQIYGLGLFSDGRIMLGSQDVGTFIVDKKDWLNIGVLYGDGGDALERKDHYLTLSNGTVRMLKKNDLLHSDYVHPPSGDNPFTGKLISFPLSNSDSFFFAGAALWLNIGSKWEKLNASLRTGDFKVTGFDVNEQNSEQLFVAFDQPTWDPSNLKNKFFKSLDGGITWEDITHKLPILAWRHITSIVTNHHNPLEVIVSLGTMDDGEIHKAYRSIDGGETWTNYSEGLIAYETFKLYFIEGTTGVFLSTLDGLYYRKSTSTTWQKMGGKIPNVAIRDFEVDVVNGLLYAATYGNGLWRFKIPKKMLDN
jgi:photosystem II stability/assembly factor-like uncharacterized protein